MELKAGTRVVFRNGETCRIQEIITRTIDTTLNKNSKYFKRIEAGTVTETIVIKFDDGEITIADKDDLELLEPDASVV